MGKPSLPFLAAVTALLIGGCLNDGGPAEREINWRLSDSLKAFDSVLILIADGSGNPLDTVFQGKLNNPYTLPTYTVPARTPENFQVQILGLSSQADTQYISVIRVSAGQAAASATFRQLLFDSLTISPGVLFPAFSLQDLRAEYQVASLPPAADSLSITAFPADTARVYVELNGAVIAPTVPSAPQPLAAGNNFFRVKVVARDGSGWTQVRIRAYH